MRGPKTDRQLHFSGGFCGANIKEKPLVRKPWWKIVIRLIFVDLWTKGKR